MNQLQQMSAVTPIQETGDEVNFSEYFDILIDHKWIVFSCVVLVMIIGSAYAFLARPIYESNFAAQVEDSEKSAGSFLGDAAASFLSVKTPAAGEIEVIKSRSILGQAVENTKLYITAVPRYAPVVGAWMARRAKELSKPGFLGMVGYVTGTENITVPQFDVPVALEGTQFILTVLADNKFSLTHPKLDNVIAGQIGKKTSVATAQGPLGLLVSSVAGDVGAQFILVRNSKQLTLLALQDELKVVEKGKQSGVIDVSWQSSDAIKLTELLNEIGRLYVRQNIDRKAAEAEKTLGFLDGELPKFKSQLEQSEDVYNKYRNQNGTVSLDDEAKNALTQGIDLQSKLLDAQQRRRDLASRFTDAHPAVQTLDKQIAAINAEIGSVDARVRRMPMLQQSTLRMQRDIKVNTDLYVSLLNSSLQLKLAKEGKVGNVRLLDNALMPEEPVRPKKTLIVAASFVVGIVLGAVLSIIRGLFFGGIRNPNEIEAHTGLNVYSSIPLSNAQRLIDQEVAARQAGTHVLALSHPEDPSVESLRSLRTALQFAMLEAPNNRVLITGGTPGVGKSFVSVNFAAIVASSGKKVLLIDADMRKGHINQVFSLPRASGLSELIVGTRTVEEVLKRNVLPNLDFITTGVLPPNPAELLMSEAFASHLDYFSEKYDLIIIDSPPVLVAADTSAIAPHSGTLLLIARAEKTQLGELNESVRRLAHAGCTVNGVIFNAMDLTRRHYGSYGYRYGGYKYTQYKYGREHTS